MSQTLAQVPVLSLLVAGLLFMRLAGSLGHRAGLVDHPDARKQHQGAVPLTGGISVFATYLFGIFVLGITPYSYTLVTIACMVLAMGLIDDVRSISATVRLLFAFFSGVLMATWGGIAIVNVGNLLGMGDIPLLLLAIPLTALAVAGLSNAYNMIDGIDGLADATLAVPLLLLYLLAVEADHSMAPALLALLVPLAVFLLFNLGPRNRLFPRIFLGDAGSVTLGFLVTASLVYFSQGEEPLIRPVTALWLVTLPLMDMLATMLSRWRRGKKLMRADRSHMHHILMGLGLGPRQTLLIMAVYAALCAVLGLVLESVPEYLSLLCYFLLFCAHCLVSLKSAAIGQKLAPRTT